MQARRMTGALERTARRFGWGHNDLRRPTDRIETAAVVTAIVLGAASVPFAVLTGSIVHQRGLSTAAEQRAARHEVTAILLDGIAGSRASARWVGLDGSRHTGVIPAPHGAGAGTAVRIWTDLHGNVVGPPLDPARAWERGALSFLATMAATGGVLVAGIGIVRGQLDRIRYAAWDAEWVTTASR